MVLGFAFQFLPTGVSRSAACRQLCASEHSGRFGFRRRCGLGQAALRGRKPSRGEWGLHPGQSEFITRLPGGTQSGLCARSIQTGVLQLVTATGLREGCGFSPLT